MVRESRIKEYIFPSFTVTGSTQAVVYSDHTINGEILKVRVQSPSSPGSLWVGESGGITFFRQNNVASGPSTLEWYPTVVTTQGDSVGGVQVGSPVTLSIVNSPIYYAGSGFTSGTGTTFGPITVFYR